MPKCFNTAGSCQAAIHYMLQPLKRFPRIEQLVAQRGYFVIHAPRQTGKTTAMLALAEQLTMSGDYAAVMVNGGGTLVREYAIGSDRMDLCLRYGDITIGMELKVWREGRKDPLEAGLAQLDRYLAGLGLATGWLVIFDQRSELAPIAERTTVETVSSVDDREIVLIRG